MGERIGTVVVSGGSVGGILAAAAAARRAERVVLIERDALDGALAPRKGVPQGRHNNNVTPRALAIMEQLLPGVVDELRARGATVADSGAAGRWALGGVRLARVETGHLAAFASRPCLDASLLARLRALPNVTIRDRTDVLGLVVAPGGSRVAGVRVAPRGEEAADEVIAADLVIDATGRGSRAPRWLAELGFDEPRVDEQKVDVGYATRVFRRSAGDFGGDRFAFVPARAPDLARGAVAFAVEGDRWMVLLFASGGVRPPVELDAFRAFAASLASPDIGELVRNLEPLDDGATFTYPKATRRRYDALARVAEGIVLFGDALVSTNPSWGLGTTTAALQAEALDAALARGAEGAPRRFYGAAIAATSGVWDSTVFNDRAFDVIEGTPPPPMRLVQRYVRALVRAADRDPVLSRAMLSVIDQMAGPGALFAPAVALRVLRARLFARAETLETAAPASRILDA